MTSSQIPCSKRLVFETGANLVNLRDNDAVSECECMMNANQEGVQRNAGK